MERTLELAVTFRSPNGVTLTTGTGTQTSGSEPSGAAGILYTLPEDSVVEVLVSLEQPDGFRWVRIRTELGAVGWVLAGKTGRPA